MPSKKIQAEAWRTGKPPEVGEYNASPYKSDEVLRWWNGSYWSMSYFASDDDACKQEKRDTPAYLMRVVDVFWRSPQSNNT